MSTRSVVGRTEGDGFVGRYCHTDGYPTCRAAELFETYRQLGSSEAVRQYAIREGQAGYWSSYMTPGEEVTNALLPDKETCYLCAGSGVRPIDRYWTENGTCNGCGSSGQIDNRDKYQGFHGDDGLIESWGDDWGTEWAYVIEDHGLLVFKNRNGWKLIGTYAWDEEHDWQKVEDVGYAEVLSEVG